MKSLPFWIVTLVLNISVCASAMQPLPKKPLADRVKPATHIFIGTAQKLTVMDREGEVKPQPAVLNLGQYALLEVQVEEALTPIDWKPTETVRVPYSGGLFGVDSVKESFLGRKLIYLTKINFEGDNSPRFGSTYSYFLTEPVSSKAEIQALIKPDALAAQKWAQMEWLAKCMKDADSIRIGMTREEVGKLFRDVSETSDAYNRRYAHKDCTFLRLDITFGRSGGQKENAYSYDDQVSVVSKPRLDWLPESGAFVN